MLSIVRNGTHCDGVLPHIAHVGVFQHWAPGTRAGGRRTDKGGRGDLGSGSTCAGAPQWRWHRHTCRRLSGAWATRAMTSGGDDGGTLRILVVKGRRRKGDNDSGADGQGGDTHGLARGYGCAVWHQLVTCTRRHSGGRQNSDGRIGSRGERAGGLVCPVKIGLAKVHGFNQGIGGEKNFRGKERHP